MPTTTTTMTAAAMPQRSLLIMTMMQLLSIAIILLSSTVNGVAVQEVEYGVDSSFPMHHNVIQADENNPLGMENRAASYDTFLSGCRNLYVNDGDISERCNFNEEERINMNLKQPPEMLNFTTAGFAKVAAPPEITKLLQQFWSDNQDTQTREAWPKGSTFVNFWDTSTDMMKVSDELEDALADLARPVLESWTGQSPLVKTSVYGVRTYKDGAVLSPHVDRLPLVSSCILNVAQDVDEDWPLEVIGHDGRAHNVTSRPGDMILYESHSIIHGRPFPLKGRFYANIFIHFEPLGYTKKLMDKGSEWVDNYSDVFDKDEEEELYLRIEDKLKQLAEEQGSDIDNLTDNEELSSDISQLSPHTAAAFGTIYVLKEMGKKDPELLSEMDDNGWCPIHEAARGAQTKVLVYLVETAGININERTQEGWGGSALYYAEQELEEDNATIKYLKSMGAESIAPEDAEASEL